MRSTPEVTLPLDITGAHARRPGAGEPTDAAGDGVEGSLPARLAAELRRLIAETVLSPGDALPSTRALAAHLGVSRGTVVAAYDQLLAEGYLSATAGRSTIVNPHLRRVHPRLPYRDTATAPRHPGTDPRHPTPGATPSTAPASDPHLRRVDPRLPYRDTAPDAPTSTAPVPRENPRSPAWHDAHGIQPQPVTGHAMPDGPTPQMNAPRPRRTQRPTGPTVTNGTKTVRLGAGQPEPNPGVTNETRTIGRSGGQPEPSLGVTNGTRAVGRGAGQPGTGPAEAEVQIDLSPGRPWAEDIIGAAWKAAWRQASLEPLDATIPALGLPGLREAWADHLRRMRAVVRDPAQIAVTGGGREGLALLLLALADRRPGHLRLGDPHPGHLRIGDPHPGDLHPDAPRLGGRRPGDLRVGVEEPGYPSLRKVPERFGASVIDMPVDDRGLRVDALPTGRDAPDLVIVTPSHQYPLGGSLPVDRRQALLEWAGEHGVVIVEDDYDSELRYTSEPLPALAALDNPADGRVVLLGTLSKILTPALATGFLTLPGWLAPRVAAVRADLGQPVGLVPQRAAAHYLASGALRLHTQRMRNRYRRRRAEVVAALTDVPGLRVYPMDGGLHAVVETARPEADVVAELAASGVCVSPLSEYWSDAATSGIVFGFGAASGPELAHALGLIVAAGRAETPHDSGNAARRRPNLTNRATLRARKH